jgi:ABC-type multidrug transport system fused ATPase/permease subunit
MSLLYGTISESIGSITVLMDLITHEPTIFQPTPGFCLHPGNLKLAFEGVEFWYQDRLAVSLPGLEVEQGEYLGLVGETGSGKSTVARLILRYYDVTAGSIRLNGVDIRVLDGPWLREVVGYVAQDPVLFPGSIRSNIEYGSDLPPGRAEWACRAVGVWEFVQALPGGL